MEMTEMAETAEWQNSGNHQSSHGASYTAAESILVFGNMPESLQLAGH